LKAALIIPALNEESVIGRVVSRAITCGLDNLVVVDNGSTDHTASVAQAAGAHVVREDRRGYGYACAAGAASVVGKVDICCFMDGDGSDDPSHLPKLLQPLIDARADLVLGRRVANPEEPGAVLAHQRLGNALTAGLIRLLYGIRVRDIPSFRAIGSGLLVELCMREMTYGWPVEMIVKCARRKRTIVEVPIPYGSRMGGQSKVSGTLRGTIMAGYFLPRTAIRYAWKD